jgi:hypothetical protein
LWQRLYQERFCGCGKAFEECEVWSRVLEKVAASGEDLNPQQAMNRQKAISGTWRTWQLLHQVAKASVSRDIQAHAELVSRLYGAIRDVTGARVIVDSSKRPWDAALLGAMEGVSPFFVHLVRDPRAMAYSQSKVKANPDRSQAAVMASTRISESSFQWIRRNLTADAVRRGQPADRSMLIDYHDFCMEPRAVVKAITALVGETDVALPFSDEHTVRLGGNHTVSGNPDRFRTGLVPVREDNRWKKEMPGRDRFVATVLTAPLMHHYVRATRTASRALEGSSPPTMTGEPA